VLPDSWSFLREPYYDKLGTLCNSDFEFMEKLALFINVDPHPKPAAATVNLINERPA
jgi:hypothetical protein